MQTHLRAHGNRAEQIKWQTSYQFPERNLLSGLHSTLVQLLTRFYEANGGTVNIDGHDVRVCHSAACAGMWALFYRTMSRSTAPSWTICVWPGRTPPMPT
ncbi:hypothetical protein [Niveispirillum lacus]|uniref:hypothetical protein n=1 Tax=Niveispirillum lacus TaxID=1981099 RepID=UPI001A9C652C|nr:hypothetical protein [Niveispirillum lacus]